MKSNEELLKYIEKLEKAYEADQKKIHEQECKLREQELELQKQKEEIHKINEELEKALLKIQVFEEKYNIERTRIFIPKTEKLDSINITETEEIIKTQRKTNKGKKYKKKTIDYEKLVSEVKYINPEEEICPKCGEKLITASEKVRYLVEVIPSSMKVTKIVKVSKKCPHCNKEDNKIYYPVVQEALRGSILSSSLAAYIAYHKYELGIPFEHLSNHHYHHLFFPKNMKKKKVRY